jgi:hypothetical protein
VSACLALRPSDRLADGAAMLAMVRTGAPSKKELWKGVASQTSAYTEPQRAVPTELMQPEAGASSVVVPEKTLPVAPLPAAIHAPPARPRARGWAVLLLIGGLGAAGGALAFAHFSGPFSDPAGLAPAAPTAAPSPTAALLVPPAGPCRNPDLPFDERDTRFPCSPCSGRAPLLPAHDWLMRVHGVTGPAPMPRPDLVKKVCAQVTGGPALCVPFDKLPDRTGATGRLRVTSSDVDDGRVYFSIRDAAGIVAQGFGHRRSGTGRFLESALCSGLVLVLDDPEVTLSVFLDER